MPKTSQARTSYLRDLENIRRLKEGIELDKTIEDEVKKNLVNACQLVHGALGAHGDSATMRAIISSKIALFK